MKVWEGNTLFKILLTRAIEEFQFLRSDSTLGLLGRSRGGGHVGVGHLTANKGLLDGKALSHATHGVLALESLKLSRRVLVQELVDGQEATTNLDHDLSARDLDVDALGAELVDAFSLAHEHDLQLLSVGVIVDVLGKLDVDSVALLWDVDCDAALKVDDVLAEILDLHLVLLHLLEHLKLGGLRLVEFLLKLGDVGGGALKLDLKLSLADFHAIVVGLPGVSLSFNIRLGVETGVQLQHGARKLNDSLLVQAEGCVELINVGLVFVSLTLHLGGELLLVSGHLVDVLLLTLCHLSLERLDVRFEISDFLQQAVLVLLLHDGVLLDLLGDLGDLNLELLTGGLAISHKLLVLGDILLEIIEDLKFLVEGDQGVELVLELDLLLLEGKLELVLLALVKHRLREVLHGDFPHSGDCGSCGLSTANGRSAGLLC